MTIVKINKDGQLFQATGNDDYKVKGWGFTIQEALENFSYHFKKLYKKEVNYKWS